ncbi:MAG TPA: lipoyl(octanoyl) transferase LipB [Armatimonadota bacterium]|jgi:lipoate-protein ligase B
MKPLWVADLGVIEYEEAVALQQALVEKRLNNEIPDTLLLLEHPPVITVGSSGGEDCLLVSEDMLRRSGVQLYKTNRGGNITYHGPGQLVGYPIFDLREHGKDVHLFLRNLEQLVIDTLAEYRIVAERVDGLTGVWVGGQKICSEGVAVRKWISYHGFALNVSPNYQHWSLIHPCGLIGKQVTSISQLVDKCPEIADVKTVAASKCAHVFGLEPEQVAAKLLLEIAQS